MQAGRKAMQLETEWLIQTAVDIENGVITLTQASKNAKIVQKDKLGFPHIRTQVVSPGAVRRGFERLGLKVGFRRGRRETVILEQFRGTILSVQKESGMGATKIYEQLVAKAPNNELFKRITHNMVYKTLRSNSLLKYNKPNKVPQKQRCRYEADNPDLIWHTDLHNFGGQYLIAFIDDYSRYIVHHELIPTKDSGVTKTVLEIAIQYHNRPFCIWTDNGTEFKGHFKELCDSNGIKIVLTQVKNPEQNGKCERFWSTADNCTSPEELRKWVMVYNDMPHMGLPQITVEGRKTHMTPLQRYSQGNHWNPMIPPTWTVDSESKPFNPQN